MRYHDESKDLRSLLRIGKVDNVQRHISIYPNAIVGIKRLGMIDFLRHLGWTVSFSKGKVFNGSIEDRQSIRQIKKERKAPKLTDKTKKRKVA